MMTFEEKLEMFKEKRTFVKNISKAFEHGVKGSTVDSIDYVVFKKDRPNGDCYYSEYVVVTFRGGAQSAKTVSGNSNTANLRAIASIVDGGYYEEMQTFNALVEESNSGTGYILMNLNAEEEDTLGRVLRETNIKHISDIRKCFNYCKTPDDLDRVLEAIPGGFGPIMVDFDESAGTFSVSIGDTEEDYYFND
jgi:hypothetical protein